MMRGGRVAAMHNHESNESYEWAPDAGSVGYDHA
jgi:hypothetical protein